MRRGKERVFEGVGVSSGIALGDAHLVETGAVHVPEYEITAAQVEEEQARFAKAVATAQKQIRKLEAKAAGLHGSAAEEIAILLEAHLQMLSGSRVLRGVEHRIAWSLGGSPFLTRPGSLSAALVGAIREETADGGAPAVEPELSTTGGTSDGRFLTTIAREVVEFGPLNYSIHKIDERVRIADIGPLSIVYERTAAAFF